MNKNGAGSISLSFLFSLEKVSCYCLTLCLTSMIQVGLPEKGKNKDSGVFLFHLLTMDNYKQM